MPPDSVDLQLIRALQADAKASLVKLGREVGMSAPSVMERIRKLEQAGVITGYSAIVDARRVGLDVTAFIGVSIDYPGRIDAFEQWVAEEPRVLECHHVTGGASLLLKVKCASTEGLEDLIGVMRSNLGVERTETMVVLSTSAERVALPVSPDSAAKARRRGPSQRAG